MSLKKVGNDLYVAPMYVVAVKEHISGKEKTAITLRLSDSVTQTYYTSAAVEQVAAALNSN